MILETPNGVQSTALAATGLSSSWWVSFLTELNGPLATILTLLAITLTAVKIYQLITRGGSK